MWIKPRLQSLARSLHTRSPDRERSKSLPLSHHPCALAQPSPNAEKTGRRLANGERTSSTRKAEPDCAALLVTAAHFLSSLGPLALGCAVLSVPHGSYRPCHRRPLQRCDFKTAVMQGVSSDPHGAGNQSQEPEQAESDAAAGVWTLDMLQRYILWIKVRGGSCLNVGGTCQRCRLNCLCKASMSCPVSRAARFGPAAAASVCDA